MANQTDPQQIPTGHRRTIFRSDVVLWGLYLGALLTALIVCKPAQQLPIKPAPKYQQINTPHKCT